MSPGNSRHRVASTEELEDGSRVIADIDGREVAVFGYDGDYYAVANHCIHQGGPLCEGELQGLEAFDSGADEDAWAWRYEDDPHVIVCPWHAWRFDITTGQSVDDDRYAVPTYDVRIEEGAVYVVV